MSGNRMRLAVLGSGKGSNFQSLIDAVNARTLDVSIACVVSDVENAGILDKAAKHGIPADFLSAAPFMTKLDGEAQARYLDHLARFSVTHIALAGFMRIIKDGLLNAYPRRVVNIHPSLLPAFPGLNAWRQALDYGVKVTGCTVHFVDEGTDTGPVIVQRAVPVYDEDTYDTLHARIQEQEHVAYPEALRKIAAGQLSFRGRKLICK